MMATGTVLASTAGYAAAASSAQGGTAGSPGVGSGNTIQAPVHVPVNVCGNTVNVVGLLNPAFGNRCANESGAAGGSSGKGSGSGSGSGSSSGSGKGTGSGRGTGGSGASAKGGSTGSPGVLSGNTVQAPVDVPVNACGNSVTVIGGLNPAMGERCANGGSGSGATGSGGSGGPGGGGSTPVGSKPTPPPGGHGGGSPLPPPSRAHHNPPPSSTGGSGRTRTLGNARTVADSGRTAGATLATTGGGEAAEVLVPAGAALLLGGTLLYRRGRARSRARA